MSHLIPPKSELHSSGSNFSISLVSIQASPISSLVKDNIKTIEINDTKFYLGSDGGQLQSFHYNQIPQLSCEKAHGVQNKGAITQLKYVQSLDVLFTLTGGLLTAHDPETLEHKHTLLTPKNQKFNYFTVNEPIYGEKVYYVFPHFVILAITKNSFILIQYEREKGFELFEEYPLSYSPQTVAWLGHNLFFATSSQLYRYDFTSKSIAETEFSYRAFFAQPIILILPTDDVVVFSQKLLEDVAFCSSTGKVLTRTTVQNKILGAVCSFPYIIMCAKKSVMMIPLHGNESPSCYEWQKINTIGGLGRFVLVANSAAYPVMLPPFTTRAEATKVSAMSSYLDHATRSTVMFRLTDNPVANVIEDVLKNYHNGVHNFISHEAKAIEGAKTLDDAKAVMQTSLEFGLKLYESSKGLLYRHFPPETYYHLMKFIKQQNEKQDVEYQKNLQYLSGTTLEDFEVDKRYLLQAHIKSEQRISIILHEYVNGKKSTFDNASILVSVAQAQIEKQNEPPLLFHSKYLFTNDKTRSLMTQVSNSQSMTTIVYEICFQTQDDFLLYKTSIEASQPEVYPYQLAVDAILKIPYYCDPCSKLDCIFQSLQQTTNVITDYYESHPFLNKRKSSIAIGADDLVVLYAHVLLTASVKNLPSEIAFVNELAPESFLTGKYGYCLATIYTSTQILKRIATDDSTATPQSAPQSAQTLAELSASTSLDDVVVVDRIAADRKSIIQTLHLVEADVIGVYQCKLLNKTYFLHLTTSNLCFFPLVQSQVHDKIYIPLDQIQTLQRVPFTNKYNNSLRIVTHDDEFMISNVAHCDKAIEEIAKLPMFKGEVAN